MFILYADKSQMAVRHREPLVSGGVNIYHVRFEFSADWEGLTRTAVFKSDGLTYSVLLDDSGECVIPWETLARYRRGVHLMCGVYGTRGGEVVLPTIWADLGTILEGAGPGESARPPTPDIWQQEFQRLNEALQRIPTPMTAEELQNILKNGGTEHEQDKEHT